MSDYTILNLKTDVEDMAPQFGFAPGMEARFARDALGLTKSGVAYERLAPGARSPFGHRHREQEELYVILGGSGRVNLEGEIHDVGPMDAVRVPGEVMRAFEAGTDGLEVLAFGAPQVKGDVEMDQEFWRD